MDWKNDRIEAACNISAYYSANYVFTCVHMPEESCCASEMQNLRKERPTAEGVSFHSLSLVLLD